MIQKIRDAQVTTMALILPFSFLVAWLFSGSSVFWGFVLSEVFTLVLFNNLITDFKLEELKK